jgi:PAS domain S-box-containing protein
MTIFFSVLAIVMWGSTMGSMLPLVLRRLGFDPASASAPLVATLVDVTGVVIYFTLASLFLREVRVGGGGARAREPGAGAVPDARGGCRRARHAGVRHGRAGTPSTPPSLRTAAHASLPRSGLGSSPEPSTPFAMLPLSPCAAALDDPGPGGWGGATRGRRERRMTGGPRQGGRGRKGPAKSAPVGAPAAMEPRSTRGPALGDGVRLTEPLYRALLSAVLDPTLAIDSHGRVVMASDSLERLFGWAPAELVGRNINVLMPEPHHSLHDLYLENYRRTGITHILGRTRQFDVVRRDGTLFTCELSVARAEEAGPDGGPLFIGSFRDVSDRVEAERKVHDAERRFRAIFEQSYQYIGLLTPDGTVLEANQTALDGTGTRREEVIGRKFWETRWWSASEESRESLRDAIRRAAAGEFVRFETIHRGRGDEVLSVDFSLKPVRDELGQVVLLIPEGRDITDLKRAQRAETAMLRALASIGESAAMLAHEIKNPITAVNVALRAVAHQLGADHRTVLEDLSARMQRLERIMRRTLSFTRPIELRPGPLDGRALLEDVVLDLRPEIVRQGTLVACEGVAALPFEGDAQLLREVITNLLKNALEAVERSGRVLLCAEPAPGGLVLSVEDDGPGIPDTLLASLFRPFVTTKRTGTGLGLAFCRKVVEEHGGRILVQRGGLGGARFQIELPTAPPDALRTPQGPTP